MGNIKNMTFLGIGYLFEFHLFYGIIIQKDQIKNKYFWLKFKILHKYDKILP